MYDVSAKTFKETTLKATSTASIQQWILTVTARNNIKNVIVYNKVTKVDLRIHVSLGSRRKYILQI